MRDTIYHHQVRSWLRAGLSLTAAADLAELALEVRGLS